MLDLYTMGERIRQAREDMGYTRETFSEMANITPQHLVSVMILNPERRAYPLIL